MHDSGKRQEFQTGAVRDTTEDKARPDLISPYAQMRKGIWLAKGAQKYKERNWERGIPISRCIASLERHLQQYKMGLTNEDHLAAIAVNTEFIMHYEAMIKRELLPADLDDMPKYEQQVGKYKCDSIKINAKPKKVTAYLSHPIRGKKGGDATIEDIKLNCKKAIEFANRLRKDIPELDLYVPAEHELPPVGYILRKGYMTVDQILDVDCEVLEERDLLIVYGSVGGRSSGMLKEINHAYDAAKPIATITDATFSSDIVLLRMLIKELQG